MTHWDIAFTGNWPALLVALGVAGAAGLAYVFYRRRRDAVSPRTFAALTALRVAALLIVGAFLLQPVLRLVRTEATRASVAVLVDASESMGIRDAAGDVSRFEAAVSLLREGPHDVLDALGRSQDVRLMSFGAVTAELAGAERLDELAPGQKATAVGDALRDAVRLSAGQELAGIVLLTDGLTNRGENPEVVARALGVPVFPVALGGRVAARGRFHDVGIVRLPQAPQFIVNNQAALKVGLTGTGLDGFTVTERRLRLRLLDDGQELAALDVDMPREDGETEAELTFVPKRVGIHRLRVTIDTLPEETVAENNARTFTVQVTDPSIRVLIVEGVVRSEYRFLRRVLESDPNVELTSVVKISARRFLVQGVQAAVDLSRGLPARKEDYAEFDVAVLGDIGREEFTGVQLELLKEFVSGGGSLAVLGGYHAFGAGGYVGSALADLPGPTGLDDLKTLDGANRVGGAKPGAEVLAVHPFERGGGGPMPIVAVQPYGAGRVMAMTADTTWKWKFQLEARGAQSPYYRFWRQSVRWLAGRREEQMAPDQLVKGWTPRIQYEPGEAVLLRVKVRGRDGEPEERAAVEARVGYPIPVRSEGAEGEEVVSEGTVLQLGVVPLSLGEYQVPWTAPAAGLYRVTAAASLADGEDLLGTDDFEFVVGLVASEFDRVDVDEQLLRSLAAQTGGVYHTLATAGRIPDEIRQRRALVARRSEISLWNAPGFFLVFLACVTTEWFLRKRRGLP